MQKVLFLMSRLPLPTNDGRSMTLYQYIEAMKDDYEIGIVTLRCNKKKENQPSYLKFVEELPMPSFLGKIFNVLTLSFLLRNPLQISGVYSKKAQKFFNSIVEDYKPDIIICDMIRTSRFVIKCKYDCKKILDMDDVLSNRYLRSLKSKEDPLGQFREMLPSFVLKIIRFFHLNSIILKFEAKTMKKKEMNSKKHFDNIILVSPLECSKLKEKMNDKIVKCWPVCMNSFAPVKKYENNQICFLGNIDASQNQSTLQFILDKVMTKLPKSMRLLVVGKCSDENKNKYKQYDNVFFTGYVDSVVEYVQNSLCLLAPIQYGSGIKIKVLEAMSYAVPVITSSIGAEGLDVSNNELIISNDNDYHLKVLQLFNDSNFRNEIALKGYEFVKKNHNYDIGKKEILNTLRSF